MYIIFYGIYRGSTVTDSKIATDIAYKDEIIDGNFLAMIPFGHIILNFSLFRSSALEILLSSHNDS